MGSECIDKKYLPYAGGILRQQQEDTNKSKLVDLIINFIHLSKGLKYKQANSQELSIMQSVDGKKLSIPISNIEEVITRTDSDGMNFLQVNLLHNKKILITDNLIGFKPLIKNSLDVSKLPKVVTTRDLISIYEAIEETIRESLIDYGSEINLLKNVFESVLAGAEDIGFDLSLEKQWMFYINKSNLFITV